MSCEKASPSKPMSGCEQQYETVNILKPAGVCQLCEDFSARESIKPVAVMCCEGSCLRGEIARQASNILCHSLLPERTARVCLGGAFTKNTGQRALVRNAPRVIAMEGCFLKCATRMMQGVLDGLEPEVVITDSLIDFDRDLFSADEMPEVEIMGHALNVAEQIAARLGDQQPAQPSAGTCCACSR
ncbi:putative zinc-binding protein [Fundidesulfovibrio terrae]|uniref:putative zinc-binding protein n=1 Tax=Fundidesulfovibrio terrae TaxID=2922866 RepID=UPI001FAEBF85|nr:putative zinc-binding protein [Fundidesulfovibrio terrae]